MTIRRSLFPCMALIGALAVAACAGEDTQTTEQNIDHDITVSHGLGGASLDNIGQAGFAPWSFTTQRPP